MQGHHGATDTFERGSGLVAESTHPAGRHGSRRTLTRAAPCPIPPGAMSGPDVDTLPAPARLVLASASPRRSHLLDAAGFAFEVVPADIDERELPGEAPGDMAVRLASEKAVAVRARLDDRPRCVVLAADTIVVLGERVLGKPRDEDHAVELLSSLVGQVHQVVTGVAVTRAGDADAPATVRVESTVFMRAASEDEIRSYVATGEPLDKAGAYALQGEGRRFVTAVEGSETNVIGLPMEETSVLLARAGVVAGPGTRR